MREVQKRLDRPSFDLLWADWTSKTSCISSLLHFPHTHCMAVGCSSTRCHSELRLARAPHRLADISVHRLANPRTGLVTVRAVQPPANCAYLLSPCKLPPVSTKIERLNAHWLFMQTPTVWDSGKKRGKGGGGEERRAVLN